VAAGGQAEQAVVQPPRREDVTDGHVRAERRPLGEQAVDHGAAVVAAVIAGDHGAVVGSQQVLQVFRTAAATTDVGRDPHHGAGVEVVAEQVQIRPLEWAAVAGAGLEHDRGPAVAVDRHQVLEATLGHGLATIHPVRHLADPPAVDVGRLRRVALADEAHPRPVVAEVELARRGAEIRAEDLAFTQQEATALTHRHGLRLAPSEVCLLLERTEGWAAGLHLGVGFLTGRDDGRTVADFAGDVRGIDDYLSNEILASRSRRQRHFMLQTSICERICADLANAITGQHDGQRLLEQLEHDDDFIVRLGAKPLWYRYHHLLRDALAHRLALEYPTAVTELHRRAARWYAGNNSVIEALNHAIAAHDWPYVGHIVATRGAPLILSSQQGALLKILQQVPPEDVSSTPELIFCTVVLLFHAGDYEAIPARIARAREMLQHRHDAAARRPTEIMLLTPEMLAERAVGNMPAVIAVSTELLDMLAADASGDGLVATQQRAVALNHRGLAQLWTGRPEGAARDLAAAASAARTAGLELTEINATGHLALLQILCGSAEEAAQLAAATRSLAEQRGWQHSLQTVAAHFAQALVDLERHDLDSAQETLLQGIRAHHGNPEAAQRVVSLGIEARLAVARGEPARARLFLDEARQDRSPRLHAPTWTAG
jgi:LuxR family maltose regulon positive regulatory protein